MDVGIHHRLITSPRRQQQCNRELHTAIVPREGLRVPCRSVRLEKFRTQACPVDPFVGENRRPQDGSSKIWGGWVWTKEGPVDMEGKVAICVINYGGKGTNPMSWPEQVAQGFKNGAKIVISNVENDKSTTVEKEVQFQIPPAGVGFITTLHSSSESELALQRLYCIWQCEW